MTNGRYSVEIDFRFNNSVAISKSMASFIRPADISSIISIRAHHSEIRSLHLEIEIFQKGFIGDRREKQFSKCTYCSSAINNGMRLKNKQTEQQKKMACHQLSLHALVLVFDRQIDFDWHPPTFISDICECDIHTPLTRISPSRPFWHIRMFIVNFNNRLAKAVFRINFIRYFSTLLFFFFVGVADRVAILYE